MAIEQFLLDILVCPETKAPVKLVSDDIVEKINSRIARGELRTRAGKPVTDRIDGGLLREDGKILYAIRDDIPVMLIDEGIEIS